MSHPKIKYRCDDCRHEAFYTPRDFKKPIAVKCVNCGGIHLEATGHQEVPKPKVFRRWMP